MIFNLPKTMITFKMKTKLIIQLVNFIMNMKKFYYRSRIHQHNYKLQHTIHIVY